MTRATLIRRLRRRALYWRRGVELLLSLPVLVLLALRGYGHPRLRLWRELIFGDQRDELVALAAPSEADLRDEEQQRENNEAAHRPQHT